LSATNQIHVGNRDFDDRRDLTLKVSDKKKGKCNFCEQEGHWARECSVVARHKKFQKDKKSAKYTKDNKVVITIDDDEEPSVFCFEEIMAAKQSKQLPNDILCDNQASASIFHNSKLVSNIRKAERGKLFEV
jgi:hypothetical protein